MVACRGRVAVGRVYPASEVPLICRHNRFTAECPICAKGTVLDPGRKAERRPRPASSAARSGGIGARRSGATATVSRGPYAMAGPYDGGREVRLERVPGGLRLASWLAGQLERRAPELELADLDSLVSEALEKELFAEREALVLRDALEAAQEVRARETEQGAYGTSPGRTGELRDELRVERVDERRLRIARWILRPNAGWRLQEAPAMLPAARYAEALASAAARGVLAPS